jgi:hypothetical protein
MKIALRAALALVTTAVLAASSAVAAPTSGRACFWVRDARSPLRSIDGHTVYVGVGRETWALEIFNRCPDVDQAPRTALRSRTGNGRICEGRPSDARIHVRSPAGVNRRCSVHSVRRLTAEEAAALPPRARPF